MTYKLAAEILKTTTGTSIYKQAIALAVKVLEEKAEQEKRIDDPVNSLSCSNCDQFGIGCGDCEVSDDD